MKLEDLIKVLFLRLPMSTDLFTDQLVPSLVAYDDNTSALTITTSTDHELTTADLVTLTDVIEPLPILTLDYQAETCTAIATCEFPHDLPISTSNPRFNVAGNLYNTEVYCADTLVTISGADQVEYNGSFPVVSVFDAFSFEYLIIGEQPTVTPATGTIILEKTCNLFNGLFPVTVLTSDQFEVTIVPLGKDNPNPPVTPALGFKVHARYRISGGISAERVQQSYTKQAPDKLWLFAVREGENGDGSFASQRRSTVSDVVNVSHRGNYYLQNMAEQVSIFIFIPTTIQISGREARDLVEDIKKALFKSILGVILPSVMTQVPFSAIVFNNDGFADYNTAFYIHRFNFVRTVNIQESDLAEPLYPVALTSIDINYLKEDSLKDEIIMTDKIKPEG